MNWEEVKKKEKEVMEEQNALIQQDFRRIEQMVRDLGYELSANADLSIDLDGRVVVKAYPLLRRIK